MKSTDESIIIDQLTPEITEKALLNILEDIQADKEQLQKQRTAIFNILEDVQTTQQELKRKYAELNILRELTKKLGQSLEMKSVMDNITEALTELFPNLTITYVIAPLGSEEIPNLIYAHIREDIGEKYLEEIKKHIIKTLKTTPEFKASRWEAFLDQSYYYEIISGKKDPQSNKTPHSVVSIPIVVPNTIGGLINLSSSKPNMFNQDKVEIAKTIINSAAQTIERIKALIDSEQSRVGDLIQSMSNGVIMFDAEKRILVANPMAREMTQTKKEDATLQDYLSVLSKPVAYGNKNGSYDNEKDKIHVQDAVTAALEKNKLFHFPNVEFHDRTYEIYITPVRDVNKDVSGGAIILHDITHMAEIDKMKTEFLSVAAHQLRTPLGGMRWHLEMLLNNDFGDVPEDLKETIQGVYDSNIRLIELVNDLLDVSRIDQGRVSDEPEDVDILNVIDAVIKDLKPEADSRNVKITVNTQEDINTNITIDAKRFREVIENLISNGVKYNSDGGYLKIRLHSEDEFIVIEFEDSGIGIPKKSRKHLFDKFYRAENAASSDTEGSGLGLYVVKSYIKAWGGKIEFESSEGEGTTFILSVPKKPKHHVLDENLETRPHTVS